MYALKLRCAVLAMSVVTAICTGGCMPIDRTHQVGQANSAKRSFVVHGWWVLDVRNADETPAQHVEFENALNGNGEFGINQILGAGRSLGWWSITIDSGDGASFMFFDTRTTVQASGAGSLSARADGNQLVFSGSGAAPSSFTVRRVASSIGLCPPDQPPSQTGCGNVGGGSFPFTHATLAQPVPVALGQTINLTVTISFS